MTDAEKDLGFSLKLCLHDLISEKPILCKDTKRNQKCYLSPEEFKKVVFCNSKHEIEPFISDMFSLGIVMLDIATLGKYPKLYDWNNGSINRNALQQVFFELSQRYSNKLVKILEEMLKLDPAERITI